MTQIVGGILADKTEGKIFAAIRDLDVMEEYAMVAWVALHNNQ